MKAKKIFMSLIYAAMTLSMALPVHAEQNVGDQARGLATQCPHCFGTVDIWDNEIFIREDHSRLCSHVTWGPDTPGASTGKDHYRVYEVTRHEDCRDCSFNKTTVMGEKWVLIFCPYSDFV